MTEDRVLSKQEVDELLKEPNHRRSKATAGDLLILKNEFNKLLKLHIKSSDIELVEITEGILDTIDTMEVYVESEDAESMVFTYEENQGESTELMDTVFITVKF